MPLHVNIPVVVYSNNAFKYNAKGYGDTAVGIGKRQAAVLVFCPESPRICETLEIRFGQKASFPRYI